MAKCQFTTKYLNYESPAEERVDYYCDSENIDVLDSGLCIFHGKHYLEGRPFHRDPFPPSEVAKREERVIERITHKINDSITNRKPLFCIGYNLPNNITVKGDFARPVYFSKAKFQGIDFSHVKFSGEAGFESAEFSGEAYFDLAEFSGVANFRSAKFCEKAYFRSAKFSEKAYFGLGTFSDVDFGSTKFSGEIADFTKTKFLAEETNFNSAEFFGRANFGSAVFTKEANFNSAEFSKLN